MKVPDFYGCGGERRARKKINSTQRERSIPDCGRRVRLDTQIVAACGGGFNESLSEHEMRRLWQDRLLGRDPLSIVQMGFEEHPSRQ